MSILTIGERSIILENMKSLFAEYEYYYSESALMEIICEWERKKKSLIAAFKRHPNYIENEFCIAFSSDYERNIDVKKSDDFGEWLTDYVAEVFLYTPPDMEAYRCGAEYIPWKMYRILNNLYKYAERVVSEETAAEFGDAFPMLRFHTGEKTSRAVNRICDYIGYTKLPNYNREFAKYADSLSPLVIKRHTVLSLNPLDYLTMSFGNSWASCHTIDRHNKRNMPNSYHGQYSSGTISYMLDSSSMVLYTTDAANPAKDYWIQPKINRQMFHYGHEKLIQGRLYPQDNDDNGSAYTPYRNIVQKILSEIFDFPNLWKVQRGADIASRYVISEGTHYRDYENYNNCTLSRLTCSGNDNPVLIGSEPICIQCGKEHCDEECINCCHSNYEFCANCGCLIEADEIGDTYEDYRGRYYCHACCHYCDCCREWHRDDFEHVEDYGEVCRYCLATEPFNWCEKCGRWFRTDKLTFIKDGFMCDDCLQKYSETCEECGVIFISESESCKTLCPDCLAEHESEEGEGEA